MFTKIKNTVLNAVKQINDSYEFKPLLSQIEESPVSPLGRFTFWTIVSLIVVTALWLFIGKVDIVVGGVGTGGTISGIASGLKNKKTQIKAIAVEPFSSQVLAGKPAGAHGIQGIGANFVPENFDKNVVDEIFPVKDNEAIETAKKLAHDEGILCGISSGAAMYAALEIAKRTENAEKLIVVILPDSGERYLSCGLY